MSKHVQRERANREIRRNSNTSVDTAKRKKEVVRLHGKLYETIRRIMMMPNNRIDLMGYIAFIGKDRCLYLLDEGCEVDMSIIDKMPDFLREVFLNEIRKHET